MSKTKRLLISMLTLLCCTGVWATGELNGLFTINASGDKVQFSQGNLQYFCSTAAPEWRFAEHQYDYVAFDGSAYAENSEKWIDLFGYGTSGYNNGQTCYQPYSTSGSYGDYYTNNLTGNADWGYNAISNGGNTEDSGWRTLTNAEWVYLFNTRASGATVNSTSNARYTHATINTDGTGVNGMILFPDGVTIANDEATSWGAVNAFSKWEDATKCTSAQWTALAAKGCVFLPAAGSRLNASVSNDGMRGDYRSSDAYSATNAYCNAFTTNYLSLENSSKARGFSIRLVKDYTLPQDGGGNYLLGSAYDWKLFADIVNNGTNPAANAKMTADIDLGDDQTIIGSSTHPYAGVFDGQGYTLTVHLNSASDGVAPFRSIDGATIKDLAVAGSVTGTIHCAGLVGGMPEHSTFNLITNVMVSATITTTGTHCGGILGHGGSTTNTTIRDCLFNGTINGQAGGSTVGVIWGWQTYGSVNIISCLENGTYTNCSTFDPLFKGWGPSVGSCSNNYYVNGTSAYGTQADATTLSDGTVTTALNDERAEEVWVQDLVTNQPMLKLFATKAYTVPSSGIGTFSAAAKFTVPDGLTAHYCKTYDSENHTIGVVDIDGAVPANTGVILKGTPGETYTLTGTNSTAATVTDNALVAVVEATHVNQLSGDYTNFMMSGGKFIKIEASDDPNVKMPANRAYLQILTSAAGSRPITLSWDNDATSIQSVHDARMAANGYYNLAGQRVARPTKGLYIVNGKMVIIK